MNLYNYLFFTTNCEAALHFYEQIGLGKTTECIRFGEGDVKPPRETFRRKIMHARFEGPGVIFYTSDNDDAEPMRGSAHYLIIEDKEELTRLFGLLAAGGRVTTPLRMQPWGSFYGKLTDQFGVQWMLNCQSEDK